METFAFGALMRLPLLQDAVRRRRPPHAHPKSCFFPPALMPTIKCTPPTRFITVGPIWCFFLIYVDYERKKGGLNQLCAIELARQTLITWNERILTIWELVAFFITSRKIINQSYVEDRIIPDDILRNVVLY